MSNISRQNKKRKSGRLFGVGVGPGDPELVTLKAVRILAQVPVIFVPKKLKESASNARSIIANLITDKQEVVELVLPMLKEMLYELLKVGPIKIGRCLDNYRT